MPIFRETLADNHVPPDAEVHPVPIQDHSPTGLLNHKISEESIRTDLCEGPVEDELPQITSLRPEMGLLATTTSDRAELIQRLKRGESPTWIPTRRVWLRRSPFHPPEFLNPVDT